MEFNLTQVVTVIFTNGSKNTREAGHTNYTCQKHKVSKMSDQNTKWFRASIITGVPVISRNRQQRSRLESGVSVVEQRLMKMLEPDKS